MNPIERVWSMMKPKWQRAIFDLRHSVDYGEAQEIMQDLLDYELL
jgi:hypothetical protein